MQHTARASREAAEAAGNRPAVKGTALLDSDDDARCRIKRGAANPDASNEGPDWTRLPRVLGDVSDQAGRLVRPALLLA
jgi:hypothetical protein